ncbi:TonB-dependent receptor [Sphingobium aromaticiconvertens]|uniref:TonB-dependent receptor n=1 Tax=Sphingobium aromaticiconvertens TaxID=365341 RepID=UPI003016923F
MKQSYRSGTVSAVGRIAHRTRRSSLWTTSAVLSLAVAFSATAQTVPEGSATRDAATLGSIGDIVVTARRVEEKLQDVPVSISAVSGNTLVARGVANLAEIGSAVPGVFTAPGSSRGASAPIFAIRGQINREPSATTDPSVGIYFAELPWARAMGVNAGLVDISSVQVLKGPQGTLFGRNATAGAILITPTAPTDDFEGYLKFGGGNYAQVRGEVVLNVPLSEQVALRVVGSHEERAGYLHDAFSGAEANDLNNDNLRAQLRIRSGGLTSTFIGTYFNATGNGEGARLAKIAPAPSSPQVAGVYAQLPAALAATNALGRYEFLTSFNQQTANILIGGVPSVFLTQQDQNQSAYGIQNNTEIELGSSGLGNLALKNIIGYRVVDGSQTFETIPAPFLGVQAATEQNIRQFSEELQLQGKGDGFNFVTGLFYFREKGNELTTQYAVAPTFSISDIDIKNTSYSAFAHVGIDLAENLTFTAGARITHDKRAVTYHSRRQTTPGVSANPMYACPLQPAAGVGNGSACNLPVSIAFTEPTWDVGISYHPAPSSLIYASVARGYRSGGFSGSATNVLQLQAFQPESNITYEVGTKNDFKLGQTPLRFNLAGYYTDYRDVQRTVNAITLAGNTNTTINAAKAHIWGVEAEVVWRPVDILTLTAGYAYTDPKYDKFSDLYREPTNGVNYVVDVSDSQFILISKNTINLSANLQIPIEERFGSLSLTSSYNYRSGFYTTNDINTARCQVPGDPNPAAVYVSCYNHAGRLPGYGLIDFRLDWKDFLGGSADVAFVAKNVANKYYFHNALNALNNVGSFAVQVGPPRMMSVEVRVPFGAMR